MSDADIRRMQQDAEQHADEDKRKRELADLRNQADHQCFQLEKLMTEHSDKLSEADKEPLQRSIERVRTAAQGEDAAAIKSALQELEQAGQALSKALYAQAQPCGATADCSQGSCSSSPYDGSVATDDEPIDAEFEVKS